MAEAAPSTLSPAITAEYPSVTQRIVDRFSFPAERPITTLTLYYILLFGLAALLLWLFPMLRATVSGERLASLLRESVGATGVLPFTNPTPPSSATWFSWQFSVFLGVSMIGALLLMLPTSWVYMATRQKKGFDQTMVQTLVILAMAVAGVVVIVRNSLALAFSLAGIVGAVRFRNSLPDTRDTLYVFLAIGVGLAAGVEALAAAAMLSMVFNYTVLALNRADYGMCELGKSSRPLLVTHACGLAAGHGTPSKAGKSDGKKDYNAVVVVRSSSAEDTIKRLPQLMDHEFRRWTLAEVQSTKKGRSHLKYLVRTRKGTTPEEIEDAILELGGASVVGVKVH